MDCVAILFLFDLWSENDAKNEVGSQEMNEVLRTKSRRFYLFLRWIVKELVEIVLDERQRSIYYCLRSAKLTGLNTKWYCPVRTLRYTYKTEVFSIACLWRQSLSLVHYCYAHTGPKYLVWPWLAPIALSVQNSGTVHTHTYKKVKIVGALIFVTKQTFLTQIPTSLSLSNEVCILLPAHDLIA